jgi:Zn finger protein HypA/HybF involved in hydrogenase expression
MADIADVVCAFCGSIMGLSRETPASSETHALRFFSCDTCGASDLRIDRESGIRVSGIGDQDS